MPAKTSTPKARPLPAGVYTPVITIYDSTPSQAIDLPAMYQHCQYIVRSGMHGLVYLGTNGELALLTRPERQAIIRNARRAITDLLGPDAGATYPLVAGISAQSTAETIELAREAAEAGAGWGLLLPPSYWAKALSAEAVVAYYRHVADASPLPVVIYNFPGVTAGVDLDSDQLGELAAHPNIVAVKLTCGNVGKLTRLTARFTPEHFGVFGGSSDYLLPTLHVGGNGCVTGMGNVFPRATARLYDLWKEGKEAHELQDLVASAEWACKKGLACTKYGAWWFVGRKLGLTDEKQFLVRKPYTELKPEMKKWSIDTLGVLAEMEESLPLAPAKEGINGSH